ncbi:MAG: YggT family protein [Treponema sp.]|nr:YggT family protein [Treponema sp.]
MFNPIFLILSILSAVVSVYAILCVVRIILTWIPPASGNGFTNFLAKICDPYLNLFKNIKWLRFGGFDLSPALGLCILSAVSTLLGSFSSGQGFSLSHLLQTIVGLAWNMANSVLIFITVVLIVRLITILVNKTTYTSNPFLSAIDSSLGALAGRVSRPFFKNSNYKSQLIAAIIALVIASLVGSIVIGTLCNLIGLIPV